MKHLTLPRGKFKSASIFSFVLLTSLILSLTLVWQNGLAQQVQLSLADILIGLRSKKVTLPERNKLLADAVRARGITFALTPEIEKELIGTGADKDLIEVIRQKSPVTKLPATPAPTPIPTPAATPAATPAPTPIPTPPPPDFNFYQNRGNASIAKGEIDSAVADYSKAIEMNAKNPSAFLNRGLAFYKKKNYDLAIADYDKAIELSPKESMFYFNRGNSYELAGNVQKAMADYQKAVEIDAGNESARVSLQRLQAEQTKNLSKSKEAEPISTPVPNDGTQMLKLGQLNSANAVNMVMPTYSANAKKFNIQGMVTVEVTLDEKGNVIAAKSTEGPQMLRGVSEDAARRSKFKPAMVANQAVKATGFISYNFKAN